MASNYTQPMATELPSLNAALNSSSAARRRPGSPRQIGGGLQYATSDRKLLNDAHLIHNRRINNFNHKIRKSLELMCEDKVSKNKLEMVHCSLTSSVKSTFIMIFSPDGQRVASTHGDHRIYICDLNTGKLLDTLEGHPKTPWCLAWHPSNREILASGCLAGEVRVWDLKSKACESWTSLNNTIISSLDFHPKERVLVIATSNDIHFWDWSESEPFAKTTTTHDKEKVKFVEFDSSGTKLITGISNLPKYATYSSDSLQNRIIDSYLTQGTLEHLSTDNMTQNSEITSPLNGTLNSNETLNERNATHLNFNRQLIPDTNTDEQDVLYRSTITFSRVAALYRQLEALEDSMRHTTFSPYPRIINQSVSSSDQSLVRPEVQESYRTSDIYPGGQSDDTDDVSRDTASSQQVPSQNRDHTFQSNRSIRTPNPIEPLIVSFDESLEQLQLSSLMMDGQASNPPVANEQNPIDLTHQINYMMHVESINQVNQNFIRISKLMSSVRLYRLIVQQILASNSGQGHFQPNQILTAQSVSPRSSRHASNLPIVFRNFPIGSSTESQTHDDAPRNTDPILAIQFRNTARNVPLVTLCKIDLLSARSVCIMRSQQLIEQSVQSTQDAAGPVGEPNNANWDRPSTSNNSNSNNRGHNSPMFYPLLNQLHQSLGQINHAPLTTSNVHAHISSLRTLLNNLLNALSSMFNIREEGPRLAGLIHDIANSLTGRSWSTPLGATLDDIRLDVVHTLCIVDLTLHLARQVQLLQMQRISNHARMTEGRRTSQIDRGYASTMPAAEEPIIGTLTTTSSLQSQPCGSGMCLPSTSKRKDAQTNVCEENSKRLKVEDKTDLTIDQSSSPMDSIQGLPSASSNNDGSNSLSNQSPQVQVNNLPSMSIEQLPTDRLLLWSRTQTQAVDSLQRLLVATASNMSDSHILVRIHHRLHGGLTHTVHNVSDHLSANRPQESRRRALSQDNTAVASGTSESINPTNDDQNRARVSQAVGYTPSRVARRNAITFETALPLPAPHLHVYHTRGTGQHLWFNQWTMPLPVSNSNYRLQCWNFSLTDIPNIENSQFNILTRKCRIHNDASIDISNDGCLLACLVPKDDNACSPNFDLKIFSLKSNDFGACYYRLPHGPNAITVSLSPSACYAVVGLASNKFISNDPTNDDLTIAKVFKLHGGLSFGHVRDIKIKRDDSSLSLNAIRWMPRGIVYNVGPQHHQRYQATRMRNRIGINL